MNHILILLADAAYIYGIYTDIKTRKFKNNTFLTLLGLGLLYSFITFGIKVTTTNLIFFAFFTYISLFFYKKNVIGAGDLKMLSTVFFYINCLDIRQLYVFLGSLCFCILVFTLTVLFRLYGLDGQKWKQHFKKEKYSLQTFIYLKSFEATKNDKENTVPYTIPIGSAIILSTLILMFLH